mmetsp:Transcript_125672/g.314068  ORF Transcript_125672/g.314068 Transcript_125672/m.314068 type:complete len:100 (-) Transcript_125672:80-379(-)
MESITSWSGDLLMGFPDELPPGSSLLASPPALPPPSASPLHLANSLGDVRHPHVCMLLDNPAVPAQVPADMTGGGGAAEWAARGARAEARLNRTPAAEV